MRVSNSLVNLGAGSLAGNITSAAIDINQVYGWAAQFVLTGTPTGSLKVQVSCDPSLQDGMTGIAPTNWTDLANSSTAISAAGTVLFNVDIAFYNWVRFVYTFTSGTGAITGRMNTKGV